MCCGVTALTPTSAYARDIALNDTGTVIFTANHDARSVSRIDATTLVKLAEFSLGASPENLATDSQERVWVSFRHEDRLGIFNSTTGEQLKLIDVGDDPFDVLHISPTQVAVSLYREGKVLLINTTTFEIADNLETLPHPRGLDLSANGLKLYVTHFGSGTLSIVDIATWEVDNTIKPETDGNLFQNLAVTADGTRAYVPLTRSNVTNKARVFDTTVFPVVSVLDLENEIALPADRINLDIVDEPVGIPLDAALTEDYLFILNAGSNDLTVINRLSDVKVAHLELGHNPRSMVLSADHSRLFIHNGLSGSISVVDTDSLSVVDEISVANNPLPANLLNGKRLFNSSDRTDLARDQWISCATCHFDGESDLRTWFFPDGPRNTPSLLGGATTAPYHWSGDLDELHDVEVTVRDIQAGTGLAEGADNCSPACDQGEPNAGRSQDLDDLAAFMASLVLPPNPNLVPGGYFSEAAIRGLKLFHSETTGCAVCHVPPLYTDHLRHDIGTGGHPDERKGPDFDTPSLRGIFSTAPYLHDGRAAAIEEVLTTYNPEDLHGTTSKLEQGEIDDLVTFLSSLTFEAPIFQSGFE
jgi:YVTN family beta-propeller protein